MAARAETLTCTRKSAEHRGHKGVVSHTNEGHGHKKASLGKEWAGEAWGRVYSVCVCVRFMQPRCV